jgi:ABC-type transport system involved in multi-copper enzyme maturation permease subunit
MLREGLQKLSGPWAGWRGLVGPLFGKDLRVASRRSRSYGLRFAYVVILLVFITVNWIPAVSLQGSGVMSRAQMNVAARTITTGIVTFQLLAAPLVALLIMSAAISEEVYGRTLGVLLTTPLSSRQVVVDKLLSRLWQILLLVATSLPALAIVRILGGIPWNYLIVSLGLTLLTVVFVGSVSLFFSSLCRRAYVAVIASTMTLVFLFAFAPFLGFILWHDAVDARRLFMVLMHGNPYLLLYGFTDLTITARGRALSIVPPMISCCMLLAGGSVLFLAAAVHGVRWVALRRAMGEPAPLGILQRRIDADESTSRTRPRKKREIRRVVGPAMVWKEMVCPLSHRQRLASGLAIGLEVLLVLIAYSFPPVMEVIGYDATHLLYLWAFLSLGVVFTITASAAVISAERECGSWPVLLVTPLTNRDILIGKLVGVLRRCGPIWLPLPAYLVAFTCARCLHPLAIAQGILIVLSTVLFLSATGFYFSGRFTRTTDAVTANLVLAGILWCVLPGTVILVSVAAREDLLVGSSLMVAAVPFAQAFALTATTLDGFTGETTVPWFRHHLGAAGYTGLVFFFTCVYGLVSLAFLWRAVRAFRRRIV